MPSARDMRIIENRMNAAVAVSFRTTVRNAAMTGASAQGSVMEYIGRALAARAIPRSYLQRAHRDAGNAGRRALVSGYTHRKHRRPVPSYREPGSGTGSVRFAGGILRRALNDPSMVEATPYVLRFINTEVLNKEAKQWRRLNFGAGGGSTGGIVAPGQFPVQWDGLVQMTLGLTPDPRPGFTIPQGKFVSPGGGRVPPAAERRGSDMFFLGNPHRRFPTAGIASSNFLDAGVRALARQLPRSYQDMAVRLVANQARGRTLSLRVGEHPILGIRL